MNVIYKDLVNKFDCKNNLKNRMILFEVFGDSEMETTEIGDQDSHLVGEFTTDVSTELNTGAVILLLITFNNIENSKKRRMKEYFFSFINEVKLIITNELSDFYQFICDLFDVVIQFIVKNLEVNCEICLFSKIEKNCLLEKPFLLEDYLFSAQSAINDVFEILISSTGNKTKFLESEINVFMIIGTLSRLDYRLKITLLTAIFGFNNSTFFNELAQIDEMKTNSNEKLNIQVDQYLILNIVTSLVRISSIMLNFCNDMEKLEQHTSVLNLRNSGSVDLCEKTIINKLIYSILNEFLKKGHFLEIDKDLITSIGTYLSFYFIAELYSGIKLIEKTEYFEKEDFLRSNIDDFLSKSDFSNIGIMSFYRGSIVFCSIINNIRRKTNSESVDFQIFNSSLFSFKQFLNDYVPEDCSYAIHSLINWISKIKYELSFLKNNFKNTKIPFAFYFLSISELIFSLWDQPITYHSRLAIRLLEEFVGLLLIVDENLRGDSIEELGSDPINWFIEFILNYSWKNYKYKICSLLLVFKGILNVSRNNELFLYLKFGRLSSLKGFRFINIFEAKKICFNKNCREVQLFNFLIHSLSNKNLSSSAFNLIFAWFKLIEKFNLNLKISNKDHKYNLLDFMLLVSIRIIKYDFGIHSDARIEIVSREGKVNLLVKLFQLFEKIDKEYYYFKLPFIFDFFMDSNIISNKCRRPKLINSIQANILLELKKNGFLYWKDSIENNSVFEQNHISDIVVSFNNTNSYHHIFSSSYIIDSIIKQKQCTFIPLLNLISKKSKVLNNKNKSQIERELLNEIQYLIFVLFNLKTKENGILCFITAIFNEKFTFIKSLIQDHNKSSSIKKLLNLWLKRLFTYLYTSLGPQISYDRTTILLPILCNFLNSFYLESGFEELFDFDNLDLKNDLFSNLISRFQSILFSSSINFRESIAKLLIGSKYRTLFKNFYLSRIENENLERLRSSFIILKSKFISLRPREYRASSILIYIYIQTISKENYIREDAIDLFINIFGFKDQEFSYMKSKTNLFIIRILNNELISVIKNYMILDNNQIPPFLFENNQNSVSIESIIYLLGICFKYAEMSEINNNSIEDSEKQTFFGELLLESIFILLIVLFIILRIESFFVFKSNELINSFGKNKYRFNLRLKNLEEIHRTSRIIEELCTSLKVILDKVNLFHELKYNKSQFDYILNNLNKEKVLLNFVETINFSLLSEDYFFFINIICSVFIQFILICDHPGNLDNLIDLFSVFFNSFCDLSSKELSNNMVQKRKKNHCSEINLKISKKKFRDILDEQKTINHGFFSQFLIKNKYSTFRTHCDSNKPSIHELPKIWLLHLIYSIAFKEYSELFDIMEGYKFINYPSLDYVKIDEFFDQILHLKAEKYNGFITINGTIQFLDINELFIFSNKKLFFSKKFRILSPKRDSYNLCNLISILMCLIIKDSGNIFFLKSVIKLLILISFNSNNFLKRDFRNDICSNEILSYYEYNIHCNHILANLIGKSSNGNRSTFFELFDVKLLCGTLIAAFNNFKIYDFKIKNINRFMLCNSSLNLMSALIKKFSFEKVGTENDYFAEINIEEFQNYSLIEENNLKFSNYSTKFGIDIYRVYLMNKNCLSEKVLTNYLYLNLSHSNFYNCYSLSSIKRKSDIFENCLIEILSNSNFSQFQGMILLFLSEISISWFECTLNMATCIIKSLYSPFYYIRLYTAKVLNNIIIGTLNTHNSIKCLQIEATNTTVEGQLYSIFVSNSSRELSSEYSLLQLFYYSIEYCISCPSSIKYNLFHGLMLLGIKLMNSNNIKLFFSLLISEKVQNYILYENLLSLLLNDLENDLLKNYLIRVSVLEFTKLLLEIEHFDKIPTFKRIELSSFKNYFNKNIFLDPFNSKTNFDTSFSKEIMTRNTLEYIINTRTFTNYLMNSKDYTDLNKIISFSLEESLKTQTSFRIIHPKVLSEFYFSIRENQKNLSGADLVIFTSSITEIILQHLKMASTIKNYNSKLCEIYSFRNETFLFKEIFCTIVEYLSFLSGDERISQLFEMEPNFCSIFNSIFEIIDCDRIKNYKNTSINRKNFKKSDLSYQKLVKNLDHIQFINLKFIQSFSLIFIRYYKQFYNLKNKYYETIRNLENKIFRDFLKVFYQNNPNLKSSGQTFKNKYNICNLIRKIFKSIMFESTSNEETNKENVLSEIYKNQLEFPIENESTITKFFHSNTEYWYNIMITFIYALSDEIIEIRNEALEIFEIYYELIFFFCKNVLKKDFVYTELNLRFFNSSTDCIKYIIKLNDGNSCLFSLNILESLTIIFKEAYLENNSNSLFPKELDNICNEYIFIVQISSNQIQRYMDSIKFGKDFEVLKRYFNCWMNELKQKKNLFFRVKESVDSSPEELLSFEILGSVLNCDIDVLFFIILFKKLILTSKFYSKFYSENLDDFEDILKLKKNIDFLISDIYLKC